MTAFGRLPAADERDHAYAMMTAVAARRAPTRTYRYWGSGWVGDQFDKPHCVGFSWVHWLEDGPVTQPGTAPVVPPATLYAEAQVIDEWPGTDYEGTSVRAGAKVLQARGFIESYLWAYDVPTIAKAILSVGPVVVGTNWYDGMMDPDTGRVRVSGVPVGGHAYLLNGVNVTKGTFRIKNSWGSEWGIGGTATIDFESMQRLIDEDGEACLAIERRIS